MSQEKITTVCIHGGEHKFREDSRAISFPIYQTSSFSHTEPGHNGSGFDYTRESNPTRSYLEETVSSLENAVDTVAFSSGMAAIAAWFELFSPDDNIICSDDLYGGTVRYINNIAKKNGYDVTFVNACDLSEVKKAVKRNTKGIFIETPGNPMMNITDIRGCAQIAHSASAVLCVDNTFMSPYLQNPLNLGADFVIHSGTKFLSGHNDTISGFLSTNSKEYAAKIRLISKTVGYTLSPFDSWLVIRGIKTLAVRIEREQETAEKIARWLKTQEKVENVYYAGLEDNKGFELNKSQAKGGGCMISFTVNSKETAIKMLENVKIVTFAESLGGCETLLTYPTIQTHPDVPTETKEKLGITDRLLRLSVGLEDYEDLINDLSQAMNAQ